MLTCAIKFYLISFIFFALCDTFQVFFFVANIHSATLWLFALYAKRVVCLYTDKLLMEFLSSCYILLQIGRYSGDRVYFKIIEIEYNWVALAKRYVRMQFVKVHPKIRKCLRNTNRR